MADALVTTLRVVHIVAAILWIGGGTLWGLVVMPTLGQMGPTLPKGTMPTLGTRIMKVLPGAGVVTFLAGFATWWLMTGGRGGSDPWSMAIMTSMGLTLLMLAMTFGLTVPTFRKMSKALAAPGPPGPEMGPLREKLKHYSLATLGIGWLVVLLMVVAVALRTT